MKLLGNTLLVQPDPIEEMTKSGILLPEESRSQTHTGTVTLTGTDCHDFEVGQKILYEKYGPTEFSHDKKTYYRLDAEDVMAVFED